MTAVRVHSWALISASAAPILLIGGWTVSAALQPNTFDSSNDTISALAGLGATNRWVMAVALLALGVCHIVTASGISEAALPGRIVLAIGGVATIGVGLFPLPTVGESSAHTAFAGVAFACLAVWPFVAWRRSATTSWALRSIPSCSAALVLCLMLGVLATSLAQAHLVGAAERLAAGAQAIWPFVVVWCARAADKHE